MTALTIGLVTVLELALAGQLKPKNVEFIESYNKN